jgi:NADH-quinone oxidoreductase subunit G
VGESRPAWKVLRVLGNLLGIDGFGYETIEDIRNEALGDPGTLAARLTNATDAVPTLAPPARGLERVADVPIYAADILVRRASALQMTADARAPEVGLPSGLWSQLNLSGGDMVRVTQGQASVVLPAREDRTLAANVVRVAAGHPATAGLGPMFGTIAVERT